MTKPGEPTFSIGVDLGGTKMLAAVFDGEFKVLARSRKKTKGRQGAKSGVARIVRTIREAIEAAELDDSRIDCIGVGCPSPVDMASGVILDAPNLGWRNVALKQELETEFGCPAAVLNDVDAGVFGEYLYGAAEEARSALGVFPGTGIGGGFVHEGNIFHGVHASCLEFGHLKVTPGGRLCGCGSYGCLETEASRLAISADAASAVYRGQAPHLAENCGADLDNIRSKALADSIEAGDVAVEQIVRRAAACIGRAVGGVVNLLAPEVVLLGGGLVEAMPELFVNEVREAALESVMPIFAERLRVTAAKLGDDAAIIGAAAWARKIDLAEAEAARQKPGG